ncbi:MFS transporter [Novosphingobium sp. AP12]|uniref:MFS transporter n=1 Tax=Novosphingobium sp. AP12 TaxID=1144305 RepID=UPI000271E21F|nr:MFS transporter [Novosphingobium sp. AP12]EJL33404.1 arabinose efflux permease family protein [Novosphingobium sp. AP12]
MTQKFGAEVIYSDLRGVNPLQQAFKAQCESVKVHCPQEESRTQRNLTLLALALGTFTLGTSEFASMGIIQLFSGELGIGIPEATNAITAYAIGVVMGAPLFTILAARFNRRPLLISLIALIAVGNFLSGIAPDFILLMAARFLSGLPHGAYVGAAAVVASYIVGPGHSGKAFAIVMFGLTLATIFGSPLATFLGQTLGWRETFAAVGLLGAISFVAILAWVPKTDALNGGSVMKEIGTLRRPSVWIAMLVAATGISSVFAIYTFIGPLVTDVAKLDERFVPIGLAVFGVGMTLGNLAGGRIADADPAAGILIGYGGCLVVLVILAVFGHATWVLFPCFFAVGALMMAAIPTIQVRLTKFAPEAPTLMGAMNVAALNVANALGAWAGAYAIHSGYGLLSAAWAGFVLTAIGFAIFMIRVIFGPSLKPKALEGTPYEIGRDIAL